MISRHLARVFNKCLETGSYPDILKVAKVIPLHKKGSKCDVGNYKPISILSPVNKVFEIILHRRLIDFWNKYNLFTDEQFRFRKQHSTNLALTLLYEYILNQRDNDSSVCGIFIDSAKAFDSVSHRILLSKLEHYGVRGNAIRLIKSYLTNRMQYIESNEQTSKMLPITIGVPQGCVLGPFLFLVYINDLPNSCNSEVLLYADDAVLLCKDKTHDELKSKSDIEIQKIESWVISNKLTINSTKTNCLFFLKPSKNIHCKNLCIRALNGNITELNVVKYLGANVDKQLSWQHHIQSIVKKLTTARDIISKLRHYAPPSILRNVYFSIAFSYLQYGITTWGNSAAKYVNKIQVQQNCIVKTITKTSFFKIKLSSFYDELKLLKLNNIYKLEVSKLMYKFKSKSLPICFNEYFVLPSKVHSYSTRFVTGNNYSLTRFNKSNSQRSIRYQGPKIWNELLADIKNIAQKNKHVFIKKIKEFLHLNQK